MRILGVNGIYNASWSKQSFTDRLLDALSKEHDVVDIHYPWMLASFAYFDWSKKRRAKKVLESNKPGDVLVAHSFGCLCSLYAMRMGAKFSTVFYFGAAMDDNFEFPEGAFNKLYNICSTDDTALAVGEKLPGHEFGPMGKTGYKGTDPRIVNVQISGLDHNDYVAPKYLCEWSKFIVDRI